LPLVRYIHERKTARFFVTSCRLGVIVGNGRAEDAGALGRFGGWLGHAFQISDDLLDVAVDGEKAGKTAVKDPWAGKQTFPRCVGIEESRAAAHAAVASAIAELACYGPSADDLRALAAYVADRNY
jgi:geranylgeranyl pyrophosphate synthase